MSNNDKNAKSSNTSIFGELDLIYEAEKRKMLLENMTEDEFIRFFESIYYKYEDAFKRLA